MGTSKATQLTLTATNIGSLLIKTSRKVIKKTKDMNTENVKSENSKLPILDDSGMLHPEIESLLRFTIRQWSSLNEQNEPDHQQLVQHWLDGDLKDWVNGNYR